MDSGNNNNEQAETKQRLVDEIAAIELEILQLEDELERRNEGKDKGKDKSKKQSGKKASTGDDIELIM